MSNDVTNALQQKLEVWVNNPPDFDEMHTMYKEFGRLKALIKRKEREITRVEDGITAEIDKPRSNEAKKAKLNATTRLKDDLAELEAEYAIIESEVKALEFMRSMFNAANYRMRLLHDFA